MKMNKTSPKFYFSFRHQLFLLQYVDDSYQIDKASYLIKRERERRIERLERINRYILE
jgi:hypothetical protein